MIIDLDRFIANERPLWNELEAMLNRMEAEQSLKLDLEEVQRFHYLYERVSTSLGKIMTFSSEPELRGYLENLVACAYGEIQESRDRQYRISIVRWLFRTWPRTFRRHIKAFWMSVAMTLVGMIFGAAALTFDSDAKEVIMPFSHLLGDPADRVAMEESAVSEGLAAGKSTFSSELMTHNTRVSMTALALGMTWGIGTIILLFYNGVILGAVAIDYMLAGQTVFLFGWLLPHGSIEIPAILIAGQAGLVLAGALFGWSNRDPVAVRLRKITPDLMTLIFGVALMLVWAGLVEAFLSQYHEPVIPYSAKIAFGSVELLLLIAFLWKMGSGATDKQKP